MMQPTSKIKLKTKLALGLVLVDFLTCSIAFAGSPKPSDRAKYWDFYNKLGEDHKKGNQANSGCRLVVCLIKPGGPMSEKECRHDYKALLWNLVVPPLKKRPPSIPICFGSPDTLGPKQSNGLVKISESQNTKGQFNGITFNNDQILVQRRVYTSDRGEKWVTIYTSTRTDVYSPENDITDTNTPNRFFNTWVADGSPEKAGLAENNDDLLQYSDILPLYKSSVNPFKSVNLSKMTAVDFENTVIAKFPLRGDSTSFYSAYLIQAAAPRDSKFRKGDRVIFGERFRSGHGGDLNEYQAPAVYNDCKPTGKYVTLNGEQTPEVLCKNGAVRMHEMAALVDQSRKTSEDKYSEMDGSESKVETILPTDEQAANASNYLKQDMQRLANGVNASNSGSTLTNTGSGDISVDDIIPQINVLDDLTNK